MITIDKVLYTAHVHTTGGRNGRSTSDDKLLDVALELPKSMGGQGAATNPEQLFAAGYSACFIGALRFHAGARKLAFPADASVDAECDVGPAGAGFGLAVRMKVTLPGMDRATAQALVDAAHETCPYSRAVRGNIAVELTLG
ncbi:MAG: organic hydroperoxide resistance protein [Rubrivivax sp.]|jgi:Ohr subfamily peroxiredoxin